MERYDSLTAEQMLALLLIGLEDSEENDDSEIL